MTDWKREEMGSKVLIKRDQLRSDKKRSMVIRLITGCYGIFQGGEKGR